MTEATIPTKTHRSLLRRAGRILVKVIASIFLLLILVIILVQTPPVQNFLRKKAQGYLSNKLHTRVEIGKIYIGLPRNIVLDNIYVEDLQKDTLLFGGQVKVDISMLKLLHNEIEVNEVQLQGITAKVKRLLPDTTFNFQFIIDAFAPKTNKPVDTSASAPMNMAVKSVILNNIRMVYQDVITGNDMDLFVQHFDARIDVFDMNNFRFDVPVTRLKGVRARVYQSKPLVTPEPVAKDLADAKKPIAFQLNFKEVSLNAIDVDYRNDVSAFYTTLNLGQLVIHPKKLDLQNLLVDLGDIELNNTTASVRLGKSTQAKVIAKETSQEVQGMAQNNWRIKVGALGLNNNNIKFDNDNAPRQASGMDFNHLKMDGLTFHVDDLLYSTDSIAGSITRGEFKEQSGFALNTFQTNFLYASNQAYLKDLLIKTPGTTLQRSLSLSYPSIASLQKDISKLKLDIDLTDSKIQAKDILAFVPALKNQPSFSHPGDTWFLSGRVTGSVADLNIQSFQFQGLQNTRINLKGTISGLPDINKTKANLTINSFATTKNDIAVFVPRGSIPNTITLPRNINISGTIYGSAADLNPNLRLNSTLGNVAVSGNIKQATDPKKIQYNVILKTMALNLGVILQNEKTLGTLTSSFKVKGRGTDPKTANATFEGVINSVTYNQYNYKDFKLGGSIANQHITANAGIVDPNIHFAVNLDGNIAGKYPSIKLSAMIDSIKTLPLHLTTEEVIYHGKIDGSFPVTDPDHLQGELLVTNSILVQGGQRLELDTMQLAAGNNDKGQYVQLITAPLYAKIEGQYQLSQLGNIFMQAIQPYFAVLPQSSPVVTSAPYNFTITASVVDHPLLKVFMPTLVQLKPVNLQAHFASDSGWQALITAPLIVNGTQRIENVQLKAGTGQNAINMAATIAHIQNGTSMNIYGTSLTASIANNQINFDLINRDKASKEKYRLGGLFSQKEPGNYSFSLKPDSLLLNYDKWSVNAGNAILITSAGINVNNFVLSKSGQELSLNSKSPGADAPLDVKFTNFQLATFTGFVKQDSLAVNGTLNGTATLNNLMKQPVFTSDLTIENLALSRDTIGNVNIKVNNTVPDTYTANVTITGRGNDIGITGTYLANGTLDLDAEIRKLELNSIEGATNGAIRDASGTLNGKFRITGTAAKPLVNGDLNFDKTRFNLAMLNSYFSVDQEKIAVDKEGIKFSTFTVKDSSGNTAVLDGNVYTTDFAAYKFDLTLKARDFRALNTTKRDNKLFYGQLYFNSDLRIGGNEAQPAVDGSIRINDKTKFTFVLPQPEPGVIDREGIVEFVNMSAGANDSILLGPYDSLNKSPLKGLNVAANIEVDKNAVFSIVIDEGNGDFLNVRGEATLTAGIDPSGNVTLTGSYELEEGSYELTFNFLHRKFDIQKGSRIVWTGTPTQADVDLAAVYIANTSPLELVENELASASTSQRNIYRQKLPFQVFLKMTGQLLKPQITFDVVLPTDKNYNVDKQVTERVETKLAQLRQEPSEVTKQVFALLLLGRFVSENPFASSEGGGGGFGAEAFARQSVSKILTEQLNKLATSLIQGVDLNFDVVSADDYTTGTMQNRTDLNVALSKRLLNDRLNVTVGSNFELEGPRNANQQSNNIAGNIAVDYTVSKDGRYKIRAYRKNEYEGVLDGYIIETGVGFIITLDYDHFRDLFRHKKNPKKEKDPIEENKNTTPVTDSIQNK